jgi:hypothetical protein
MPHPQRAAEEDGTDGIPIEVEEAPVEEGS